MTALRPLDIAPYQALVGDVTASPGPAPALDWIEVSKLVIDPTYQREILRRGARNVVRIARQFDWRKFAPVIVAPIEGGRFAIVDGQHRSTAAALRGIRSVPCQIIMADPKAQAEAFAAINGNVTAMTPLQIHVAKVASGDPDALEIDAICRKAGVSICRYPVPASNMKRGETLAIGSIRAARRNYGDDILVLAMRCILAAPNGNPGMVRADVINALCSVINEEKLFTKREARLLELMAAFDFSAKLSEAEIDARRRKMTISAALAAIIFDYLDSEIGEAA